jgi:hypothetical protein
VCHRLALLPGKLELLPDALEGVSLGHSTGVAFIDHRSQRGELCLIVLFLALQRSKRRANYFPGVLVPAAFDLGQYEAVKLIGRVHVASGYVDDPRRADADSRACADGGRIPLDRRRTGLYRFDSTHAGRTKHQTDSLSEARVPTAFVQFRTVDFGLASIYGRMSFLKQGKISSYHDHDGTRITNPCALVRDPDGAIWMPQNDNCLLRSSGSKWEAVDFWCEHDQPTWPISGKHCCRKCWRPYVVPWSNTTRGEVIVVPLPAKTEYARIHS